MISVLMPTYNEAGNIVELIKRTAQTLKKNFEIIVIDDNSPDSTSLVVKKLQPHRPYLRLITRTTEKGLPSAVARGIKEAKGEVVAWFDCDLSVAPEELARLAPFFPAYDLVLGSTFIKGGADARGDTRARFFSWLINKLAQMMLTSQISDYTSALVMAKKKILAGSRFDGAHGTYLIGLLYQVYRHGFKIKELPYCFGRRGYGESKITGGWKYFQTGLVYLYALIKAKFHS
jgi:dolichol-phosphate mannosyltransferase